MRTTIDLPDDLHQLARQLAFEGKRSLSDVVVELIRLGMGQGSTDIPIGRRGMPVVAVGRPVTAEDVRSLDDDE